MLNDGKITKAEYNKLRKGKKKMTKLGKESTVYDKELRYLTRQ